MNRIELSAKLSALEVPKRFSIRMEQYPTDVRTAIELLSFADSLGRISGRDIADFGCGNGILGIGAALLGARSVDMYDIDGSMTAVCETNIKRTGVSGCSAYLEDFFDVDKKYDTVIANPPFGIQSSFNIRALIIKLEKVADTFFFIYKSNSQSKSIADECGLSVREIGDIPIPNLSKFHRKRKVDIPVCVIYKAEVK